MLAVSPNSNILTPGLLVRKASDLNIGDIVLDENFQETKVIEIANIKSDAVEIHSSFGPQITGVFSIKSLPKSLIRKRLKESSIVDFEYNSNFEKLNLLATPLIDKTVESNISPNQARLLGYFAAEGSYPKKHSKKAGVQFTFGYHEKDLVNHVVSLFEEEFSECSVTVKEYPERSVTTISVTGYNIQDYFAYHVGEYSRGKQLSEQLVFSSKEVKQNFLIGWLEGDGCYSEGGFIGVSTSVSMVYQIFNMFESLRIPSSIREKETRYGESFRLEVKSKSAFDLFDGKSIKYSLPQHKHKNMLKYLCSHKLRTVKEINHIQDQLLVQIVTQSRTILANAYCLGEC
jgi:hypothetical protein